MFFNLFKKKKAPDKYYYYSNVKEDNRESRTFSQIKKAQEKVDNLLSNTRLKLYIAGGTVPYFILNEDSKRLHDDIDTICRKEDLEKIRQVFIDAGLYDSEWDSKNYSENGEDYGFEMKINGVPYGIFPFEYDEKTKTITQYSADPYLKICKTKKIQVQELSDYIMSYKSVDGKEYNTMSLEYIKITKDNAKRPKDMTDSKKIEETKLLRQEVLDRVQMYVEYK